MGNIRVTSYGKMSPALTLQTVEQTLKTCSKKSQKVAFQCLEVGNGQTLEWHCFQADPLPGARLTLNIGEYPNAAVESFLSQILIPRGGAAEILFDPESVQGDIETSGGAQERAAFSSAESTRKTGEDQIVYSSQSYSTFKPASIAATLKAKGGFNGVGSENIVDTASAVLARNSMRSKNQGGIAIFDMTHANNPVQSYNDKKCHTLTSRMGTGGNQVPVLHYDIDAKNAIRKLTPAECERLQGLPDGYTDIEFNGKPASDARRYKALGNGMAQPCADYILARIVSVHDKEEHKKEEKKERLLEISLF